MSWFGRSEPPTPWENYPTALDDYEAYDAEIVTAVPDGWFSAVIWAGTVSNPTFFGLALDDPRVVLVENERAFSVRTEGTGLSRPPFIKRAKSTSLTEWIQASHPFYEDDLLTHYLLPGDETVVHVVSPSRPVLSDAKDYEGASTWARTIDRDVLHQREPV